MEIRTAHFLKSATDPSQFPQYPYPEFAFFGRSNVGKSSLIGYILGGKAHVKTSSKPGHTQTINFFVINDSVSVADLPGFGYAKAPAGIRDSFMTMLEKYISARKNLRIAFLLIDARRGPEKEEHAILDLLIAQNVTVAIVVTKCDKLTRNDLAKSLASIAGEFEIESSDIFTTSSLKKHGAREILDLIKENSSRSN
jgi:GTP-binding protein